MSNADLSKKIEDLTAKLDLARSALKHYTTSRKVFQTRLQPYRTDTYTCDDGETARTALAQLK
jgi:hypothetical protein